MEIADQIKQTFIDETEELLGDLEGMLLDLESDPENSAHLDAVFRLMHTIKGSSGMVGEEKIYKFSHMVEDVFDLIRKGKLGFNQDIANIALESRDIILSLIRDDSPEIESKIDDVKNNISTITKDIKTEEKTLQPANKKSDSKSEKNYRIKFMPDKGIFLRGGNPLLILKELADNGTITVNVIDDDIPLLSQIENDLCYTGWEIFLTTKKTLDEVKDIFLFV